MFGRMEYGGDYHNPGPVGKFAFGREHEACRYAPLVWARFLFIVVALPAAWAVAVWKLPLPWLPGAGLVVGGSLIYVALGYLIEAEESTDKFDLHEPIVDPTQRLSDDVNRTFLFLASLLGPGRFVAESVLDWLSLIRRDGPAEPRPAEEQRHGVQ